MWVSTAGGHPPSFSLNVLAKGLTEGVQLMVLGEKRRFWIPGNPRVTTTHLPTRTHPRGCSSMTWSCWRSCETTAMNSMSLAVAGTFAALFIGRKLGLNRLGLSHTPRTT